MRVVKLQSIVKIHHMLMVLLLSTFRLRSAVLMGKSSISMGVCSVAVRVLIFMSIRRRMRLVGLVSCLSG